MRMKQQPSDKPKDNVEEPVSKDKPLHDIAGAD